jgi:hypothetical protein
MDECNPAVNSYRKDSITITTIDSRDSVRRQHHSSTTIERLTIAMHFC